MCYGLFLTGKPFFIADEIMYANKTALPYHWDGRGARCFVL